MRSLRCTLLLAVCACAARRTEPLRAPEMDAVVSYSAGDPIGGARSPAEAEALTLRAEDALPVAGRLWLVAELPGERFDALTAHLRLIVAGDGAEPLSPRSLLTADARLASGAEAAALADDVAGRGAHEAALLAEYEGLVLPGVTTIFSAAHAVPIDIEGELPSDRRFAVDLWREGATDDSISLALSLSDVIEVLEGLADARPSVTKRSLRELLVLDARLEGPELPVAVFAPARFDPDGRLSYVLVLEARPRPADAEELAALSEPLARIEAEVRATASAGSGRREQLALADRLRLRRLRALDALTEDAPRRAALVELAGPAQIAAEFALLADDAALADFAARLVARADELRALAGDGAAVAWALEAEAVRILVEVMSEDDLAPEHAALLLRHAGEAGRYPGALEDALAVSKSLADFTARVLEENRVALEDPSPAARVRAYDWLTTQDVEIPGYDPLGLPAARRAALRAWAAAAEAAPAGAESGTDAP